jgi:hypothetical protein
VDKGISVRLELKRAAKAAPKPAKPKKKERK